MDMYPVVKKKFLYTLDAVGFEIILKVVVSQKPEYVISPYGYLRFAF